MVWAQQAVKDSIVFNGKTYSQADLENIVASFEISHEIEKNKDAIRDGIDHALDECATDNPGFWFASVTVLVAANNYMFWASEQLSLEMKIDERKRWLKGSPARHDQYALGKFQKEATRVRFYKWGGTIVAAGFGAYQAYRETVEDNTELGGKLKFGKGMKLKPNANPYVRDKFVLSSI